MFKRLALTVTVLGSITLLGIAMAASTNDQTPSTLTVHEWGTFTSVAGPNGKAMAWLPLSGPNDLPCFVNYYQNRLVKSLGPVALNSPQSILDYNKARGQLTASVRMETPVLYFYAPKEETVNVRVAFPQGFITEWYPKASVNQNVVTTGAFDKPRNTGATITWNSVKILPRNADVTFPGSSSPSHYYAARNTDANPLRAVGSDEKFLFYRGVGGFPVPINVTVTSSGQVAIKHLAGKPVVILFESRGGKLGYTLVDTSTNEAVLDSPPLTASFEMLRNDLEHALIAQGLYAKEASAMIETWRNSWFEEGTRVFYIVPPTMVDTILPLTIEPRPQQIARVFVGRVEVFTPATLNAVETAVAANDATIVDTYGRFLGPIIERIPETKRMSNGANLLEAAFKGYVQHAGSCSK
jgi:hypothetical protein